MIDNGSGRNEQSVLRTFHRCFLPSFALFGQAVSEEKIFRDRPVRNKSFLWRPCLITDRDKMFNPYRGPSIDASHQVLVHLAKGFQRRRLKCEKLTDDGLRMPSDGKTSLCFWKGEQNCLWWSCLLMDWNVMINLYRWPSMYASYQVSVHLAKRFQRRNFALEINQSETRIACDVHVW